MLSNIYLTYGALITPLGNDIESNWNALLANQSGIKLHPKSGFNQEDLYLSLLDKRAESDRYDSLLKNAIAKTMNLFPTIDFQSQRVGFIVSSTKGNLWVLPNDPFASTKTIISEITGNTNVPIILSNACISGVSAINIAANSVRGNQFDHVVVIGIDIIWDFVKYGFQSLYAMSPEPVRPFDTDRKGVNLGEACAIVIVSNTILEQHSAKYLAGTSSNDANHISGPSRTGEGLVRTVEQSVSRAGIEKTSIDFISGHGTGTLFNDEMESIAFDRLQIANKPIHSLKGYYGHTLGAAGVVETVIALKMMEEQLVISSLGYTTCGTSKPLNIITKNQALPIRRVLKTASGFGGGNASLLFEKL